MDRWLQTPTRLTLVACWAVAWLVVAALLLLPMPVGGPQGADKVVHFLLFAGLAFGAVSFSRGAGQLAGLALVTITGGTLLEFAQRLTSWRTFDLADAATNVIGATSGFALALLVLFFWIRRADPAQRAGGPAQV